MGRNKCAAATQQPESKLLGGEEANERAVADGNGYTLEGNCDLCQKPADARVEVGWAGLTPRMCVPAVPHPPFRSPSEGH